MPAHTDPGAGWKGVTIERLRVVERLLLPSVLVAAVLAVVAPGVGVTLAGLVTPLLALLMLVVSLTFDLTALRRVLARPRALLLAVVLVYGPMSVAGWVLGRTAFGSGPLGVGFVLVGVLPTDVSSPLLVLLARGNVALATIANAVNTSLAPILVPALFLLYTGVDLDVPVSTLVVELAVVVLAPTALGVTLRTRWPARIAPLEPAASAGGSLVYVLLVLAVVGPNADAILERPATIAAVAGVALALNTTGYLVGWSVRRLLPAPADASAMLFTVSKKEFTIAAFIVFTTGLPSEVALPAVAYAVVQMVTSPLVATLLARRAPTRA